MSTDSPKRDFTLTWTLDASPAEVYRAWTDPEHLEWYFNDHQPLPDEPIEVDLRVGGEWRQMMVIDEETRFMTGGIYRELVPDERIVFAWGATDGWPKLDQEQLDASPQVTVTLTPDGEQTVLSVNVALPVELSDDEVREWWSRPVRNGWQDTVDRLAALVAARVGG